MKSVYILSSKLRGTKIGISGSVERRADDLSRIMKERLSIEFATEPRRDAWWIERAAHKQLADKQVASEWFDVTVDEARSAVALAITIVESQQAARRFIEAGRAPRPWKNWTPRAYKAAKS